MLEDNPYDAELIIRKLKKESFEFDKEVVWSRKDFIESINKSYPDVIIADHSMPQFTSSEAFSILEEKKLKIPFIVVSGSVTEDFLIEAMNNGVDDYILKGNLKRLPIAIQNVVNKKRLEAEKEKVTQLNNKLNIMNGALESVYLSLLAKNRDITDGIRYARKIQKALTDDASIIGENVSDFFIFSKAKDLVSGDFSWYTKVDDKLIFAVIDCTGHGIPGSLLSIIGNIHLNNIVLEQNILDPREILKSLHSRVRSTLHQDKVSDYNDDGMDVAICCLDLKEHKLTFSGALRPLYLIKDGKLTIVKGDRKSIGGAYNENSISFKNSVHSLNPGDLIYLFSDGYADQFGGEQDRKYTVKKFRELLLSFVDQPLDKQKKILEMSHLKWKGDKFQVDDITVMGIKI